MRKDTKSLGNGKAPACESRGFVRKKKEVRILTHPLFVVTCFFINRYIYLLYQRLRELHLLPECPLYKLHQTIWHRFLKLLL